MTQLAKDILSLLVGIVLATLFLRCAAPEVFAQDRGVRLEAACHDIRPEPNRDPDKFHYDSNVGLATALWEFPDGAVLVETFQVPDFSTESPSDYSVKAGPAPLFYQMFDKEGKSGTIWIDPEGKAKCHDIRPYS